MMPTGLITRSLVIGVLAACGPSAPTARETPGVGESKSFATACEPANDGSRIALEGYLRLPDTFSGDRSVVLRLIETDQDRRGVAGFDGTVIGVQIRFGADANQIEHVPDQYSDDDLQVHLADGRVVDQHARVRVSGTVYFPVVAKDLACALEDPLVELGS